MRPVVQAAILRGISPCRVVTRSGLHRDNLAGAKALDRNHRVGHTKPAGQQRFIHALDVHLGRMGPVIEIDKLLAIQKPNGISACL